MTSQSRQTTFTSRAARREKSADGSVEYRADIDGLRALAIVLVVIYHVWLGRVSGGVDVFLMISAFFLTASFVRKLKGGTTLKIGTFWLRKFRRLLPAAATTILGVAVVAFLSYPQLEWPRIWREGWASLLYFENWSLAASNVDYYARDAATPSAFQHFWSLSVQGQVFILWPLLFVLVALIARRRRERAVPLLTFVFSTIFVLSLAFSVYETYTAQSFAYFDTRTRLWEFAAGSLIALALPYLKPSPFVRVFAGWAGVVGIVVCGIVLDVQSGFPGYLALWPVLCTAAVIVAGQQDTAGSPTRLLASKPLRFLGRDAYALYLVHWPVLITWKMWTGRAEPGPYTGLAIILVSFVLARLISWGVEQPLRRAAAFDRHALWGAAVVACTVAAVAVPLAVWQTGAAARDAAVVASGSRDYPGAAQVDAPDEPLADVPLRPPPLRLTDEWVDLGTSCGGLEPEDAVLAGTCASNEAAHRPGAPLVLVMGDSHAQQLTSPLRVLADEKGWGVVALLKGGCSIGVGAPSWSDSGPPCDMWRKAALEYAADLAPDAVYLVVTRATPEGPEVFVDGIREIIDDLTSQGIRVIAVRDNPRFRFDMYECATSSEEKCDVRQPDSEADLDAIARRGSVVAVDFSPWLCPDGVCMAEIGNTALYIDDNHISDSYGKTLAPMLARMLDAGGFSLAASR